MQPARQCCHGDVRAVRAALPNVGEHLRLALTPSTGKTKVAQFQQRRVIIRQQRVVELQVSVQHTGRRVSPWEMQSRAGLPYMCVHVGFLIVLPSLGETKVTQLDHGRIAVC